MISEKIILQTDFKEIAAIQLALCVRGKNLSPEVWEKNSYMYPNQITHTPLKSQMVIPLKRIELKLAEQ